MGNERTYRTKEYKFKVALEAIRGQKQVSIADARQRIGIFIEQYNSIRPHASLGGLTPDMLYWGTKERGQAI